MNLDIYIKNLIRTAIKVVPVLGAPIDQATFGFYESLRQQESKNKFENLQKTIWRLILDKRSEDDILHIVTNSKIYKELNNQISIIEIQQDTIIKNEKRLIEIIELQNEKINELKSYIEETNEGLNYKIHHLTRTISTATEIVQKANLGPEIKFIINRRNAIELSNFIHIILDISYFKNNKKLLLDPYIIFNCTHFPNKETINQNIEILYTILLDEIKLAILNTDLPELISLKRNLDKLNPRYSLKYKTIPSAIAWKMFNEILSRLDIITHEISKEKVTNFTNKILPGLLNNINLNNEQHREMVVKSTYNDISRYLTISDKSDLYLMCSNVLSQRTKFIYNFLFKELTSLNSVDWDALKLALYSFFSLNKEISCLNDKTNIQKTQLLLRVLDGARIAGELSFTSSKEIEVFSSHLKYISSLIYQFREHLKINVFQNLSVLYEEELEYMANYIEFAKAYFEIESIINQE